MSKFWRNFITNGEPARSGAYLGLTGRNVAVPAYQVRVLDLEKPCGVQVQAIKPESPAEEAGIVEDDVLLLIADRPTPNVGALHELLTSLPVDVPLTVVMLRRGRILERILLLSEFPNPARRS